LRQLSGVLLPLNRKLRMRLLKALCIKVRDSFSAMATMP
jgi:hypothetical protein